jgi:hypothetical protein
MAYKSYEVSDKLKGDKFEIEPFDDEPVLLGSKIAYVIEYLFPGLSLWMKDKDCSCDAREEWLNDKHWAINEWFKAHRWAVVTASTFIAITIVAIVMGIKLLEHFYPHLK